MKKIIFFTSLFCIVSVSLCNAQGQSVNKGFFGTLEAKYMQGFNPNDDELPWNPYGKSLRLMVGYFVNPHLSAGIGFGADRYESYGVNTLPLFADFRGYLKDKGNTPYVFADAGYSVRFSQAQDRGFLIDAGLGYKFLSSKKIGMTVAVGYNYKEFPYWWDGYADYVYRNKWYERRHSVFLNVGMFF